MDDETDLIHEDETRPDGTKRSSILGNIKSVISSRTNGSTSVESSPRSGKHHESTVTEISSKVERRELASDAVTVQVGSDSPGSNSNGQTNGITDLEYKRLVSHAVSLDETESIGDEVSVTTLDPPLARLFQNKVLRKNWQVYLGAFILTLSGTAFIVAGLTLGAVNGFSVSDLKSIVFLVGGILCIIPGAYHFIYMTCAGMGVKGFKFSKLATVRKDF